MSFLARTPFSSGREEEEKAFARRWTQMDADEEFSDFISELTWVDLRATTNPVAAGRVALFAAFRGYIFDTAILIGAAMAARGRALPIARGRAGAPPLIMN
jgi:hypothetical protein